MQKVKAGIEADKGQGSSSRVIGGSIDELWKNCLKITTRWLRMQQYRATSICTMTDPYSSLT